MMELEIILVFTLVMVANGYTKIPETPLIELPDGNKIPALAYGTRRDAVNENGNEIEQAVRSAIAAGFRSIDTAAIHETEDQVGRAITKEMEEGRERKDLFITAKLGDDHHAKDEVIPALNESLHRLNLAYVNLYVIDWPLALYSDENNDTDYLDTWRGMIEAKKVGHAVSIGVSNFNQEMIDKIINNGLEIPSVLQIEFDLKLQLTELVAYCKKKGIVIMAHTPFSDSFEDFSPMLLKMAEKYDKSVTQLLMRYLRQLGLVPILNSVNKTSIVQGLQIFDFELTEEDMKKLKAFDKNYRILPQLK